MNKYERYEDGVLVESAAYTEEELAELANNNIKSQIEALERLQTPRRLREALNDPTWLNDLEAQINTLRAQLT